MRNLLFVSASVVTLFACRTTQSHNSSDTQSNPESSAESLAAEEDRTILDVRGRTAKNLYAALDIQAVNVIGGGSKSVEGNLDINCVAPHASPLPAGAQGMPSIHHAECEILKLPEQVIINGIIAPDRIASLRDKLADKFYGALDVEELESFPPQKQFRGKAKLSCSYALVSGGFRKYECSIVALADDSQINSTLVSLKGETARKTLQEMTVAATNNNNQKTFVGDAIISCLYEVVPTGGPNIQGGQLPPGVQGMPALGQVRCSVVASHSAIPPGAQGIAAPHIIVSLEGNPARDFYTAFAVSAHVQGPGETTKRYEGKIDFTCTYNPLMHLTVEQAYRCSIVKKQ